MQIHFFEEFPSDEHLSKAALIDFPSTIFLAANTLSTFWEVSARLRQWQQKDGLLDVAYWPVLPRSYWISPFAHTDELRNLGEELSSSNHTTSLKVMLDLELPLLQKRLFWQNSGTFSKNKAFIQQLFSTAPGFDVSIYTAEYPVPYQWTERLQERLGISFPMDSFPHTRITMFYSSILSRWDWAEWLGKRMLRRTASYGRNFMVGVGTIATGIFGNEPILSPRELHRDLSFLQQNGVQEVVIFRLGGLSEAYMDVIRSFLDTA